MRVLPVGKTLRRDEANYFVEFPQQAKSWGRPRWVVTEEQCPVQCGGGQFFSKKNIDTDCLGKVAM